MSYKGKIDITKKGSYAIRVYNVTSSDEVTPVPPTSAFIIDDAFERLIDDAGNKLISD